MLDIIRIIKTRIQIRKFRKNPKFLSKQEMLPIITRIIENGLNLDPEEEKTIQKAVKISNHEIICF